MTGRAVRREMTPQAFRRSLGRLTEGEAYDLVTDIVRSLSYSGTDCTPADRHAIEDVVYRSRGDAYAFTVPDDYDEVTR